MPLALDENTLACTYATLILHDENLPITSANIQKLVTASGVQVASFWPGLFVSAMQGQDMAKLVCSLPDGGSGGGGGGGGDAAPAAAAAGKAPEAKKEEKKKAPPPAEEEDMGFSLFD